MNSRLYRLISPKTCSIKLKIMWQKLSQNMKRVMLIQRIWFLACSTFPMSNSQKIIGKHVLLTRSKFPQMMWSNFPHGLIKYSGAEHPCHFHYFLNFKRIFVQINVHRRNLGHLYVQKSQNEMNTWNITFIREQQSSSVHDLMASENYGDSENGGNTRDQLGKKWWKIYWLEPPTTTKDQILWNKLFLLSDMYFVHVFEHQ